MLNTIMDRATAVMLDAIIPELFEKNQSAKIRWLIDEERNRCYPQNQDQEQSLAAAAHAANHSTVCNQLQNRIDSLVNGEAIRCTDAKRLRRGIGKRRQRRYQNTRKASLLFNKKVVPLGICCVCNSFIRGDLRQAYKRGVLDLITSTR